MHVAYDRRADRPFRVEITLANVNDVTVGKSTPIEADATYVFDKGYYDFKWWAGMDEAGALLVTRPKTNTAFAVVAERALPTRRGDGFVVLEDCEVKLASKGDPSCRCACVASASSATPQVGTQSRRSSW